MLLLNKIKKKSPQKKTLPKAAWLTFTTFSTWLLLVRNKIIFSSFSPQTEHILILGFLSQNIFISRKAHPLLCWELPYIETHTSTLFPVFVSTEKLAAAHVGSKPLRI